VAQESPEQNVEFTEELPPLRIDPTSFDARVAKVEPCSVVREISKRRSTIAAFDVEQAKLRGEVMTEQEERERRREAWRRKWKPKSDEKLEEHVQYIKRMAARFIDWGDLGQLWNSSLLDTIELWKAIRLEAGGRVHIRSLRSAGFRVRRLYARGFQACSVSFYTRRPCRIVAATRSVRVHSD
jgi:hypothetical protein